MSVTNNSSLGIPCPLGKCGDGSLYPHALQVALTTDAQGAVWAYPASNGVLVDDQANYQAGNKCRYVGNHRGEEKLPLGELAQVQGVKVDGRLASQTFRMILIFLVKCTSSVSN